MQLEFPDGSNIIAAISVLRTLRDVEQLKGLINLLKTYTNLQKFSKFIQHADKEHKKMTENK